MKRPDLLMDSEMEQPTEAIPEDKNTMMDMLRSARDAYTSYDPKASQDRVAKMVARKLAEKQGGIVAQEGETPDMAEQRMADSLSNAGQMGMQAGMSVGSVAPIGVHSQVAKGLAQEIGALGKAQQLSNLAAKPAAQAMKTGTKMSPEEMKALAQAMLKRGM
jgi:hypothetical protein